MSYPGTFFGPPQSQHQLEVHSSDVGLKIRQQPAQALVTLDGKEKSRKPIDPPPIIQLEISQGVDPHQHFLVNPYYFMYATLLPEDGSQEDEVQPTNMLGQLCSSLHRLKDVNNADGGFFIFGDLSVRHLGVHRLRFALYDYNKDTTSARFVTDIISNPFQVVASKDFRGMEESSYLSRAFSDQGVRLRLRKEPRSIGPRARYSPPATQTSHSRPVQYAPTTRNDPYGDSPRGIKRQRSDSDYSGNASVYPPSQVPRTSGYPSGYGNSMVYPGYAQTKQEPQDRLGLTVNTNPSFMGRESYQANTQTSQAWPGTIHTPSTAMPINTSLGNMGEQGSAGSSGSAASIPRLSSSSYFGNTANYGSFTGGSSYMSNSGGSYAPPPAHSRAAPDAYPATMGEQLQTPTSMTDTPGQAQGHDQYALQQVQSGGSMGATAGVGHQSSHTTPVQNNPYSHDYSSLPATYGNSAVSLDHTPTSYQTTGQQQQAGQYPSSISHASMPPSVSNMLLSDPVPPHFYGQDESAAYPTPNQQNKQW